MEIESIKTRLTISEDMGLFIHFKSDDGLLNFGYCLDEIGYITDKIREYIKD